MRVRCFSVFLSRRIFRIVQLMVFMWVTQILSNSSALGARKRRESPGEGHIVPLIGIALV